MDLYPVRYVDEDDPESTADVQYDRLWLQEIEQVFGFPEHYTDVGYMSCSERQKILGHAWSVPVIKSIFQHLKGYVREMKDNP